MRRRVGTRVAVGRASRRGQGLDVTTFSGPRSYYYVFTMLCYVFTTFLTTSLLRFHYLSSLPFFTIFLVESVGNDKAACGILDTVRCMALDEKVVIRLAEPEPITTF